MKIYSCRQFCFCHRRGSVNATRKPEVPSLILRGKCSKDKIECLFQVWECLSMIHGNPNSEILMGSYMCISIFYVAIRLTHVIAKATKCYDNVLY